MAMGLPTALLLVLLLVGASLSAATNSSAAAAPPSSTQLDPKQARALQSLGLPTSISKDPCSSHSPLPGSTELECDTSTPLRHVLSLTLTNCPHHISLTSTALKYLSTLHSLRLVDCPSPAAAAPLHLPPHLASFTCISSLRPLTGVCLSRLRNLSLLTVSGVPINASGPAIILGPLKYLQSVTISNASLTGHLPRSWQRHHNLTHLDLSLNQLRGNIPHSITALDTLVSLNLSSNQLSGEMPTSIGDLIQLRNLSFASNSLSGSIPESLAAVPSLVRLDLSSNQLNGTIPGFLGEMKELQYLNLESNSFQGVMPFNATFIRSLRVFKIGQNPNLCYNHSTLLSGMKLGIAPCDRYGLPLSPPATSVDSGGSDESDYSDSSDEETSQNKEQSRHHGPNKVVLGVAIAISSIIFFIIFLILLSKWCA